MKLLLHICCGPCAVYPVDVLQKENIDFEGVFFNPNIHPIEEFIKRRDNAKILSDIKNFPITVSDQFQETDWLGFTGTSEERCNMCYSLRLERVARMAKEKGFDAFTTTLLVSPYQKHELIKELGEKMGTTYGIDFYYRDLREGFRQGQQQARELGLYRQKYCGCIISRRETPVKSKGSK
ncbi:MAG TPA: epoxyqueuosine reductase QueH [Clostridiaceae bacterium]|nr:epoxyqueuosine reductase QueH [Clostridiaceae bacterium]